jgi:hypothetical protein
MASHGRRGLSKLIMGSVKQKVLSDSKNRWWCTAELRLTRRHSQITAYNPKEWLWNTSMNRTTMAR